MAIINTINVVTAGQRVQAGDSGTVHAILFRARTGNTGLVYVGDSNVSSSRGIALEPGEAISITVKGTERLQDWYADADNNGDKADYVADNS